MNQIVADLGADRVAALVAGAGVAKSVEPTLLADSHASYSGLTGYRRDPRIVGKMAAHVVLPWVHRVFSLMRRWGLGTYHGLRRKHLDTYLNEFVFRHNVSFEALLRLAAKHEPASYMENVKRDNPRKGVRTIRRAPRRRKTANGMRQDRAQPAPGARHNQPINPAHSLHVDELGTTG